MFERLPQPAAIFRRRGFLLSFFAHAGLIGYLCWQPEPQVINRVPVRAGDNGTAIGIVYLPTDLSSTMEVNEESHSLKFAAVRRRPQHKPHHTAPQQTDEHPTEAKTQAPAMGNRDGDSDIGPLAGSDASPALPIQFPDPHIGRSDLPPGVIGDVVVEVTIDSVGNIIRKKVLQSFGYGVDEKVLAVLENWRFRPATVNGLPVASRQDVHFHFPS